MVAMPWAFRNCGWSLNESLCVSVGNRKVNGTAAVKVAHTAEEHARHKASLHERDEGACDFFRVPEEAPSQALMSGGVLAGTVTAALLVCIIVAVLLYVMRARNHSVDDDELSNKPESSGNAIVQRRSMGGSNVFPNPAYDAPTVRARLAGFVTSQPSDGDPYLDLASNLASWDMRDELADDETPYGDLDTLVSEYNNRHAPTANAVDRHGDVAANDSLYGDIVDPSETVEHAAGTTQVEKVTTWPTVSERWDNAGTVGDAAVERYPTTMPSTDVSYGEKHVRTDRTDRPDNWDGHDEQAQGGHIVGARVQSSGQSIMKLVSRTQSNPLYDGHDVGESGTDGHGFMNAGFGGNLFERKTSSLTSSQRRSKVLKKRSLQQSDEVTVNNNYKSYAKPVSDADAAKVHLAVDPAEDDAGQQGDGYVDVDGETSDEASSDSDGQVGFNSSDFSSDDQTGDMDSVPPSPNRPRISNSLSGEHKHPRNAESLKLHKVHGNAAQIICGMVTRNGECEDMPGYGMKRCHRHGCPSPGCGNDKPSLFETCGKCTGIKKHTNTHML